MPLLDLAVGADRYAALKVPDDCTVGNWKKLLGQGFLGDKILYPTKLVCREEEKGRVLEDAALLPTPPGRLDIEGPGSVVKMVELALKKKLGPPIPSVRTQAPVPRPSIPSVPAARTRAPIPKPKEPTPPQLDGIPEVLALRSDGAGENVRFYRSGMQGMRPHMEDRTCGVPSLPGCESAGLFGVFDGHGGHKVAEYAVQTLPSILACCLKEGGDPGEALIKSFRQLDKELWSSVEATKEGLHPYDRVGSTAVVSLLLREAGRMRLICANCGDSRAVLCRKGRAFDLSIDQKPNNPQERSRIEAAGGKVELFGPCWRIDAGLNLSRALGDFAYKANPIVGVKEQKVICDPELREIILDKDDEFVAMGSDGVFDVMTSEALITALRGARQSGQSWMEAVDRVLQESLPGGDNVSMCFVEFDHT